MVVIISDLHLTDGTSGETIREGAFAAFRERLRDLAYDASWRQDGKYRPLEELHVILLGDIFDVIRSEKWLDGSVRPWDPGAPQNADFGKRVGKIHDDILKNNAKSLAILRSLDDGKTITLPPATAEGGVARVSRSPEDAERVPVKVHMHYLVGNHDWFYHLKGTAFDGLRQSACQALGLANDPMRPFPHDPEESGVLSDLYEKHSLFARHGDIFDSFNFDHDRDASSLGDAIVIELLNRFPHEVRNRMGKDLPQDCLDGLREIDNVRPLLMVPVWIHGLLQRTASSAASKEVKKIWDGLVDGFLGLKFVRNHDSLFNLFDDVDKLEWGLKFSRGVSLSNLSRLMSWVQEKTAPQEGSLFRQAASERAFKSRRARFIVYGHTHHHEIVPLDSTLLSGGLMNQMYINSGTWRRVHVPARLHPDEQEFLGYHVMTYLAFFRDGERGGRPFESWSGALGV